MFRVIVDGCEPKRATKYSAAIDLFAAEDKVIKAGETAKVRLGVCIDEDFLRQLFTTQNNYLHKEEFYKFLSSHYLQLEPRSSLRAKGLIAGTGLVDLDFVYPNEICIILHNPLKTKHRVENGNVWADLVVDFDFYKISKGEKIAQIMLCEHKTFLLGYESETERISGFGSTGK